MLGNLVNRHDLATLLAKLSLQQAPGTLRRFVRPRRLRVQDAWSVPAGHDQWWVIDAVQTRWRRKVTGDGNRSFATWMRDALLPGRTDLDALMIGCGAGHSLSRWMATGCFRSLRAFDIAPAQIERARQEIARAGLGDRVQVEVADARKFPWPVARYDVVIAEQSLHHLTPLEQIMRRIQKSLRPGGLFFIDEFVGARQHQWTARQLEAANTLLATFPEERRRLTNGLVKQTVIRPSLARMFLTDPSEAIESTRIMPLLHEHFDVLTVRGYGGTVLHTAFAGIAHHFTDDSPETRRLLEASFAFEDQLLASRALDDDFVVAVARKR